MAPQSVAPNSSYTLTMTRPPLHMRQSGFFGMGSIEVEPAKPGEGPVRRLDITKDRLITQPSEGNIQTIPDILAYATKKYGKDLKAVAWRDVVKVHEEEKEVKKVVDGKETTEKKTWKYFELSDYKHWDYTEFEKRVCLAAKGFVNLGVGKDDIFNIYATTSPSWQIISQACASISTTVATAYETLGESGLKHSLNEPESVGLFTNADLLSVVLPVLSHTPSVKYVIYDGSPSKSVIDKIHSVRSTIKAIHLDDLLKLGESTPVPPETLEERKPTPDTVACIMYTSGSTGVPKGVILSNRNLIASVGSVHFMFKPHLPAGDRYLAYLPLAHVLEYIIELTALYVGITIGYARPKTLTSSSVRQCPGDLEALKPNIMFGVPAVWETIKKGIISQVEGKGALMEKVFWGAMEVKKRELPILSNIVDRLVFEQVRKATGGQLRFGLSGSSAISSDTMNFLSDAVVPLTQAYGMTESCGMCTMVPPELRSGNTKAVGLPVPSIEIKLLDVPEAGYTSSSTDSEGKPKLQTGEVCIRGPSVTRGYLKRDDLNKDETIFTKDGWFRTGDVGQWNEDGTLSLIDRVKNLIKLQNGEYIAIEYLESIYKSSSLIGNICVYASQEAKRPIAIVIPHEQKLRASLNSSNTPSDSNSESFESLCANPEVHKLVLTETNKTGKSQGLNPVELLCDIILTSEDWTTENGFLSPAHKVQRVKIAHAFKDQINEAYKRQQ